MGYDAWWRSQGLKADMATVTVPLTVSEELVAFIGSADELADRARESLVLDLLREGEISQGKAAELLGISRQGMMQLAAQHCIPFGPQTIEEVERDVAVLARLRRED